MKLTRLLPTALLAPALALAAATRPETCIRAERVALDDPPPVECLLCGGDPTVHNRVLSRLGVFQSRAALRYFDAAL